MLMTITILIISIACNAIVAGDLKCKGCESRDNMSNCRKGTVSKSIACDSEQTACVTSMLMDEKEVSYYYRGCALTTFCEKEKEIYGNKSFYCKTCSGSECNNEYLFKDHNLTCMNCNGEGINSECALGTGSTISCPFTKNSCFLQVTQKENSNLYLRGCGKKNYCDTQKKQKRDDGSKLVSCSLCEKSDCNKKSLVWSCIKCEDSEENSECQSGTATGREGCLNSECYAKLVKGLSTFDEPNYERGCATSDYCSSILKSGESVKFCATCKDKSNCNIQPINLSDVELSCITCTGKNGSCVSGLEIKSKKCSPQQVCFQEYLENSKGILVRRGCGTLDNCEKTKAKYGSQLKRCKVCDGIKCNSQEFLPRKCYECKSASECRNEGAIMPQRICPKVSNVCYHLISETRIGRNHQRGCGERDMCITSYDAACIEYDGDLLNRKPYI